VTRFVDPCRAATITDRPIDRLARELFGSADVCSDDPLVDVGRPVHLQEIWAAGVTCRISEEPREAESGMPGEYLDVYKGDRPETFYEATPNRTVGPNDTLGIRGDSSRDVPEAELGVVIYRGEIVGYTTGTDMGSRSIEGRNPLYLLQAKVYDRCCAIGHVSPPRIPLTLTAEEDEPSNPTNRCCDRHVPTCFHDDGSGADW